MVRCDRQRWQFSSVPFMTYIDRKSISSNGVKGVRFIDLRIGSLLFADYVVLLASSAPDLHGSLS